MVPFYNKYRKEVNNHNYHSGHWGFSVLKYPLFMVQIGWIFLPLSSSVYSLKIIGNICLEILENGSNIPTRNTVIRGI